MSVYKHNEFRKTQDLNYREEFVLGLIQELGDLKATTLCTLAKPVYTKGSCLDALERLRNKGFLTSYKASSKRVSTFNMWGLTPMGKYYLKQVEDIYAR